MITCNRCGKQVPAGAAICSNCGVPVSSSGRGNMDAQEQPALPTWLESLRANERPRTPASGQSFSTADLFDEDDLPGWMRPERAAMAEDVNAGQYGAPRPSSMPAPNTDAGMPPPRGFSASSLIDSASLPSWVQENQPAGQGPGSGSYFPGEAQAPFSAASLIEPDSLPSWISGQSSQQQPVQNWFDSGSATFNAPQQAQSGRIDPETPPRLMSAQDLIDPQALPSWMPGWQGRPGQANQPNQQSRQSQPGQMAQSTWQGPPSQAAPGSGDSGAGLSAASLLDMNALPSWLREGQQGYTGQPGQPGQGGSDSNLSAGSLIDMNALPAWLRNADSQPQGTPPGMQQGSNVPASSGRVESIRVPSRPRAEMAPQEQSEVAATIFSSMLGVASGAPSYPAQPAPFGVQPQQNFQNVPPQSPTAIPNMNTAGQPMPPGFAGSQPMQQGAMPAGYAGGYSEYPGTYQGGQGGYGGGYPGGNYAQGPVPIQFPGMSADAYNAGQRTPVNSGNQVNQAGAKPAKRGIIDTIREWFHL